MAKEIEKGIVVVDASNGVPMGILPESEWGGGGGGGITATVQNHTLILQ